MKRLLTILILIPFALNAQFALSSNFHRLVNANQIGDELLLFVPDSAVQIMVNPARAGEFSKQFIFVTHKSRAYAGEYYNPFFDYATRYLRSTSHYSSINRNVPTVSAVYLFEKERAKWLLNISSGVDYYRDNADMGADGEPESDTYIREYKREESLSLHEISLYRIFKNSGMHTTYGIHAGFDSHRQHSIQTQLDIRTDIWDDNFSYRANDERNENKLHYDNYFIGLSYALYHKNWDFISRLTYQKSDFKSTNTNYDTRHYVDSLRTPPGELLRADTYIDQFNSFQKSKPNLVYWEMYYKRQVGLLTKQDNYFIKVSGFFATEIQQHEYWDYDFVEQYRLDTLYFANEDTMQSADETRLNNLFVDFKAGYVYPYQLDDIHIVSGIILSTSFAHKENINLRYSSRYPRYRLNNAKEKTSIQNLRLKIPLYINYAPNKWFELYGGLNFHYEYDQYKERKRNILEDTNVDYFKDAHYRLKSFRTTYLGVNLKHKSGMRIQIDFNKNFSSFNYWHFSLGYLF